MSNNPKHAFGITKASFQHIPAGALVYLGAVMKHGADKYGTHNWRTTSIDPNIYYDAILRHLIAWRDGQYMDDGPGGSGLPHLAHIMACCAVALDSDLQFTTDATAPFPPSNLSAVALMQQLTTQGHTPCPPTDPSSPTASFITEDFLEKPKSTTPPDAGL